MKGVMDFMIKTIKLPYICNHDLTDYIKNYNNVLRYTYNRVQENKSITTKELTVLQKNMNNIFLDSHFLNSAQYEAKALKDKENIIFGGKKLFDLRNQNKITKAEFQQKRLLPICSIGEAGNHSNRKFAIIDSNHILFKPDRNNHFELTLPKLRKNYRNEISLLKQLQDENAIPITYKLSLAHIYISFEETTLFNFQHQKIKDRIFAIDLNPDYIGWSVVDWKSSDEFTLIDSGVISNELINMEDDKLHKSSDSKEKIKLNNKRNFENIDSAIFLINKAIHYKCEIFSIEQLAISSKDNGKGKKFNKLVNNQWCRNILYQQLQKRCDFYNIKFIEVLPNYSSFEGNLIYRQTGLPDMCLSSIEISRRGFEFNHQYLLKDTEIKKNIVFNESKQAIDNIKQSLEELNCAISFTNIKDLYIKLKTLKVKYRVQLCKDAVFSKKSIKSKVLLYRT